MHKFTVVLLAAFQAYYALGCFIVEKSTCKESVEAGKSYYESNYDMSYETYNDTVDKMREKIIKKLDKVKNCKGIKRNPDKYIDATIQECGYKKFDEDYYKPFWVGQEENSGEDYVNAVCDFTTSRTPGVCDQVGWVNNCEYMKLIDNRFKKIQKDCKTK